MLIRFLVFTHCLSIGAPVICPKNQIVNSIYKVIYFTFKSIYPLIFLVKKNLIDYISKVSYNLVKAFLVMNAKINYKGMGL